ncbi:hypothetical protein K469DRAFT_701042 [Zopfia rhizophila CBS 207.26]|uniref:Uncharacterized protein n=1 Tax=Zopfia rhizophila CBS 207.26 TaxID=1314779 RepID=A0A6A6EGU4_9PEZI|nr:hypothetical protein K469DRAFT_701042 [Zopfia rhizophila CBS 207.26]
MTTIESTNAQSTSDGARGEGERGYICYQQRLAVLPVPCKYLSKTYIHDRTPKFPTCDFLSSAFPFLLLPYKTNTAPTKPITPAPINGTFVGTPNPSELALAASPQSNEDRMAGVRTGTLLVTLPVTSVAPDEDPDTDTADAVGGGDSVAPTPPVAATLKLLIAVESASILDRYSVGTALSQDGATVAVNADSIIEAGSPVVCSTDV